MTQSKPNKVLAILGGPHKNGTTAKMLEVAIRSCKKRGDDVTAVSLYDKNIQYCCGCRKCLETRECVMKNDDMLEITNLVRESDTIILASPVYWANVPAAVKNLFDRLLGVAMEETKTFPKPRLSGKKYMMLLACNTAMPFAEMFGQSSGAKRVIREFFKTAGMRPLGSVVCGDTSRKTELSQKTVHQIEKMISRQ